jgi:hypothetical protein
MDAHRWILTERGAAGNRLPALWVARVEELRSGERALLAYGGDRHTCPASGAVRDRFVAPLLAMTDLMSFPPEWCAAPWNYLQ